MCSRARHKFRHQIFCVLAYRLLGLALFSWLHFPTQLPPNNFADSVTKTMLLSGHHIVVGAFI